MLEGKKKAESANEANGALLTVLIFIIGPSAPLGGNACY